MKLHYMSFYDETVNLSKFLASNLDISYASFFPAAIQVWNSLPADVVCPTIATFKSRLMDITLTQQSV